MALNNKQRAFIAEYLRDFNATQAAIRVGYSENTARQQGSRLLSNANIAAEVSAQIAEKSMSAAEVLKRLAEHARGDMGDFTDIEGVSFSLDLRKAKELGLTHLIREVEDRVVMTSKDGEETETHTMKIKLYDAKSALDTLAKYHGLLIDRTDVTSGGEKIKPDDAGLDRAVSTLADAIREAVSRTDAGGASNMDAAKQTAMAGASK